MEYLRAQRKKVSGLVGHSKGGTGVILYAAAYNDIPLVVNIAGRFDNMKGRGHCPLAFFPASEIAKQLHVMSLPGGAAELGLNAVRWTVDPPLISPAVSLILCAL